MAATSGESQLQRIIRDLQDAVTELSKEFKEGGEPITDDSVNLQKFSYKLEYLLQFDQKEKSTLLGSRKDYWDYFCDCLAKIKGANDGIRFVKSITELRTSLGKGRAFIRYSLVHQRLADTLQQCFMNTKVTSDWYYARSPFLNSKMSSDIVGHLYELTDVQFDLASRGYDLDAAWPAFARRTLSSLGSSAYLWKPPSRSSSMSSLVSNYLQAQEFPSSPDVNNSLNVEHLEGYEEMRLELDQAELRQRELQDRIHQLEIENQELQAAVSLQKEQVQVEKEKSNNYSEENSRLTRMITELQKQCEISHSTQSTVHDLQKCLQSLELSAAEQQKEHSIKVDQLLTSKEDCASELQVSNQELEASRALMAVKDLCIDELKAKLSSMEQRNLNLLAKVDAALDQKGQEATAQYDSAVQIQALLEKLQEMEKEKKELESRYSSLTANSKEESEKLIGKKEKLEEEYGRREGALKQESQSQAEQLELQEGRLTKVSQTVCSLQEQNRKLMSEKERLGQKVKELEEQMEQQNSAVSELDEESRKLKAENENLQQSKKKMEEKASEKQLQSEIDDALVSVDEKEKKLRGENKQLDEDLQNARRQGQILEERLEALNSEYEELKQREETSKESYVSLEAQLKSAKQHSLQMEKSLDTLKESKECLQSQLTEKEAELQGMESQCQQLRAESERYRKKVETLEIEKLSVEKTCLHQTKLIESLTSEKESVEKQQLQQAASLEKEAKDLAFRMSMSEEQLEVSRGEVSRLQAEVLDLRVKLQQATDERERMRSELAVAEAVSSEQKTLVQQLKEQSESLNRNHVQELVQCKEREEKLKKEQERTAHQKAELESNLMDLKEELSKVKRYLENARVENEENKDLLHRTNTDMAELGIQICALTSEKVDAEEQLAQATERFKELEEQAAEQQEKLKLDISNLREENKSLQEKLEEAQMCAAAVPSLQLQLETIKKQAQSFQETSQEELSAIKFQMSTEILNYQTKFKAANEECGKVREQLQEQKRQQHAVEEEITEIQKEADEAKEKILDYTEKLSKVAADKDSSDQKLFAELDDLTRTKQFLEERLIELIRDKDALWQKSDALEFQQKLSAEQRWQGDTEVNHCLDCQREFSWMVRRHHCRMCGRIFCYYCCNNYMVTKPGGKKERCCRACFNKPRVIVDSTDDSGSSANQEGSPASLESPVSPSERAFGYEASKPPDDAAFDIITDEELCQVQESDSLHNESQMERDSLDQSVTDLTCNSSTFDESEDWQVAQDAEICLLKSGEIILPLTVEEIMNFGESNRELFIKSSTYSIIPITVTEMGLTISWIFSSDPKSISFSVVYQESEDTPLDQCKVLIPMTRCNSHKETIRGQVKVRNAGIYTLIFDNTFSRFISKRVFYHLAVERPVIYDGSDFP
uniref:FYVE and coiled-coil domain-containing protein 1 n=1 Tax=Cyanistes caeruleus TaxID=156563 RepID=A0A8C0UQP9_CYACU